MSEWEERHSILLDVGFGVGAVGLGREGDRVVGLYLGSGLRAIVCFALGLGSV